MPGKICNLPTMKLVHLREVDLQPYHTFGLKVTASEMHKIDSEELLLWLISNGILRDRELLVLGGGSNVLFTQEVEALILKNEMMGIELIKETEQEVVIRVGAGENWHELVMHCISQGWGGIENLSLIPGCVGAAPMQNIGAYGVELQQVFESLEAIDLRTGMQVFMNKENCQFGYRESVFKKGLKGKFMIARVLLRLTKPGHHQLNTSYGAIQTQLDLLKISPPTIKDISEVVCQIRRSKLPDPAEIGNAGSFFKNPVISAEHFEKIAADFETVPHYPQEDGRIKVPAGWLIQTCGYKGKTLGNYGVHKNQALVLVNYGGANGADIYALSEEIKQAVSSRFAIDLDREVNVY